MSAEERFGLEILIWKSAAHNTDVVFTVMKWMRFSLWRTCTEEKRRLKTQNIEVRERRGNQPRRPKNGPRGRSKGR